MPLFESGLPQVVFYILYLSLFVGVVGGAFSTGRRDKANPGRVKAKYGRKDSIGLTLTPFISLFLSLWFGYYSVGLLPSWSYYLGITLSILGVMLSVWAVRTLGRYMTFGVTIYNDQKVVKGGPYRFVRHPVYTASFLIFTGMGFAVQSWLAALMMHTCSSTRRRPSSPRWAKNTCHTLGGSNASYHSSSNAVGPP